MNNSTLRMKATRTCATLNRSISHHATLNISISKAQKANKENHTSQEPQSVILGGEVLEGLVTGKGEGLGSPQYCTRQWNHGV